MKKLLSIFGASSIAAFVAMFLQVAHFGRTQLLFGAYEDAEMLASGIVFPVIRIVYALLLGTTTFLLGRGWILVVVVVILAAAAIGIARKHLVDASLLVTVAVTAVALFWFGVAPWLLVTSVPQNRGLHPHEIIKGEDRISAQARENWSCVVCANVKEARYRALVCPQGHDPETCASHLLARFALVGIATLLLAGLIAYVILARGSWLDAAAPKIGFAKATLVSLSFVCITAVMLNVYAVGYVYGKTAQGFELPKVRRVQGDFRSDPLFLIAKSATKATLLLKGAENIDLPKDLRLEEDGRGNILSELMTTLAEGESNETDLPI